MYPRNACWIGWIGVLAQNLPLKWYYHYCYFPPVSLHLLTRLSDRISLGSDSEKNEVKKPFSSVACWCINCCCSVLKSCPTLCNPMDYSTPGSPVLHHLLEFAQTHDHWVGDAIQPSHLLSPHSLPALNLSQHQGLFKWVSSSHQVAKVLEFQLQHQSFQWIFRTDFL